MNATAAQLHLMPANAARVHASAFKGLKLAQTSQLIK